MNKINRVIFTDSTINHTELSGYIQNDDLLRPGIKRGDLVRTLINNPDLKSIVIVDGVFEQQASITHKEILWSLEQGVEVVGLSSIGALRAYELHDYGMLGYGSVFQSYLDGKIDGDDEVAVSYFPIINGYDKTIPMINIRVTLEKLNFNDNDLISLIRNIHFKERNWPALKAIIPEGIYNLLKAHYIDQKKEDVFSFFQVGQFNIGTSIPVCSEKNIFILKNLVNQFHTGLIDFIASNLQVMPMYLVQTVNLPSEKIAQDIIDYLELKNSNLNKIAYILNELSSFSYSDVRLKNISNKIRREQKLFSSSSFIKFLEKKMIPSNRLVVIFDGILKLEAYFLTENYLCNTV
jgi:hypothetical protein